MFPHQRQFLCRINLNVLERIYSIGYYANRKSINEKQKEITQLKASALYSEDLQVYFRIKKQLFNREDKNLLKECGPGIYFQ